MTKIVDNALFRLGIFSVLDNINKTTSRTEVADQ